MVKERKDESKDDKKPKKESDLKKFLNKRSFIYLSAAVFFVVFIVPDMIAQNDTVVVVWVIPSTAPDSPSDLVKKLQQSEKVMNKILHGVL